MEDPYGGRQPTSHERMSGRPWDASYRGGPVPWDIGRPQPALVRVADEGRFTGTVLDVGCGTGEHALLAAARGMPAGGVDVAPTAIERARAKARDRGLDATFEVADALDLGRLGRTFDTVLDCGLFHSFDGEERQQYAASLAAVTRRGATGYVLCFSDVGTVIGRHPVGRDDLHVAFGPGNGWHVVAIEPEMIYTKFHVDGASAWLATVTRR